VGFFQRLRWVLIGVGGLALLGGGASIFSRPGHEVLYAPEPPRLNCVPEACYASYALTIGNSGWERQDAVVVRLRAAALAHAALAPRASNFGVNPRPLSVSDADGVRTFVLGPMKRDERVRFDFMLHVPGGSPVPRWDDLLVAVEASHGEVKVGSPEATALGRLLFTFFGRVWW
jgi:hypothetical protein